MPLSIIGFFSGLLPTLLLFVVPGAVILKVVGLLRADELERPGERLSDIFLWSLVNWGLNTPLLYLARYYDISFYAPALFGLLAFWVFLVCPVLLALVFARIRARQPKTRAQARSFPTGWDFFFARRQACWVVCHFPHGEKIGGYFGANSSASSFPREPELFLEEIWRLDDAGRFVEPSPSAGAVVRAKECLWIEFFERDTAISGQLRPARPLGYLWRDAAGLPVFSYAPVETPAQRTPPQGRIKPPIAPVSSGEEIL